MFNNWLTQQFLANTLVYSQVLFLDQPSNCEVFSKVLLSLWAKKSEGAWTICLKFQYLKCSTVLLHMRQHLYQSRSAGPHRNGGNNMCYQNFSAFIYASYNFHTWSYHCVIISFLWGPFWMLNAYDVPYSPSWRTRHVCVYHKMSPSLLWLFLNA